MPLSLTVALSAELLESRTRRPLMRFLELPGDAGEVMAVTLPDGTVNLAVFGGRTGQVTALIVTSDKAVQVCVGDVAQNETLTLEAGGLLALLDLDVDAAHACTLSYTPGDGSEATCLVSVLGTWVQGGLPATTTAFTAWIPAMLSLEAQLDLMVAQQTRLGEALPTTPAVYRSSNTPTGAPWRPDLGAVGGGQATALVVWAGILSIVAALRPTDRPTASELWQLGVTVADTPTLLCTLPDDTTVTSLLGVGTWIFIGTADGKVYRWAGTPEAELALDDPQGGAVRLCETATAIEEQAMVAFMEAPSGLRVWMSTNYLALPSGTWTQTTVAALTGTRCANIVRFRNIEVIATGTEAGDRVDIWQWSLSGGATLWHSFTERGDQRPGALYVYPSETNTTLYVGRLSLTATPLLELWRYRYMYSDWSLLANFEGYDEPPDTNTSITAIAPVLARGDLFVATGTPYAGPAPGALIYVLPLPEFCRTSEL